MAIAQTDQTNTSETPKVRRRRAVKPFLSLRTSHFTSIIRFMSAALDLNLLALVREGGQDRYDLPGLYAVSPPRRPARGRSSDHLVIYFTLSGNSPISVDSQDQLLARLAQSYYKTAGTVTAAMRSVTFTLNQILLQRNVRSTSNGRQGIGLLTLAVIRNGALYLGHSGPVHTYTLGPSTTQEYYDTQSSGRGLGLSRTAPARYFQVELEAGQFVLFVHQPCANWTLNKLQPLPNQNMEGLRRRLQAQPDLEFNAVLAQVAEGTGRLRLLRPKAQIQDMAHPVEAPREGSPSAVNETQLEKLDLGASSRAGSMEVSEADEGLGEFQPLDLEESPLDEPNLPGSAGRDELSSTPATEAAVSLAPLGAAAAGAAAASAAATGAAAAGVTAGEKQVAASRQGIYRKAPGAEGSGAQTASRRKSARLGQRKMPRAVSFSMAPVKRVLGTLWAAAKHVIIRMLKVVLVLLKSLLPDEGTFNFPTSTMVFVAVAIPLVIGIIGAQVYVQRGLASRQKAYFDQAVEAANYARTLTEPAEVRAAWADTLEYLNQAELYKTTEESTALKSYARSELDRLDYIERLDFQPAIAGGLGESVQVTQMVATPTELYLLNGARGNVLRAILTGDGYQIDPNFVCGPTTGPSYVGPLIDIVLMPKGVENDPVILGMDANGNMEYCIVDGQPLVPLVVPPGIYFGSPKALTIDGRDVYILDPAKSAVWVYRDFGFGMQPRLFFGDEIPPIQDAIDLAVNNDDLYLLHADGHQTLCTYSGFATASTRCDEEMNYTDPRPGRSTGPVIPDSLFSQIYFSPPPDPSLYLLDPGNQAIFHFSLRLNLIRQFRSQNQLPAGPATAFAITPNRVALIAVGNDVFYALLP